MADVSETAQADAARARSANGGYQDSRSVAEPGSVQFDSRTEIDESVDVIFLGQSDQPAIRSMALFDAVINNIKNFLKI